jgi:hypothetical protein
LSAGGRYGKCPGCHNPIYVPTPDDGLEEIPLAPVDDDAERRDREARRVEADILREKEEGSAPARGAAPQAPGRRESPVPKETPAGADTPALTVQITDVILEYLVAMKNSELDKARRLADRLSKVRHQAHSRIQQLMVDAMPPPKLGDMPSGLYLGFLKKLDETLEAGASR